MTGYMCKRHFIHNQYGVGVDETIVRRKEREAAREQLVPRRRVANLTTVRSSRKGKEVHPNYKTMDIIEYAGIRQ